MSWLQSSNRRVIHRLYFPTKCYSGWAPNSILLSPTSMLKRSCSRRVRLSRFYATVHNTVPREPIVPALHTNEVDGRILDALSTRDPYRRNLGSLIEQYLDRSHRVLSPLPYESRPSTSRRTCFNNKDGVVIVAHAARTRHEHKITLCSGFYLDSSTLESGKSMLLTLHIH